MAAERREVEDRRDGNLSTVLREYVPHGETRVELERLAEEDRILAEQGLVGLMNARGGIHQKHMDKLARARGRGGQSQDPRHTGAVGADHGRRWHKARRTAKRAKRPSRLMRRAGGSTARTPRARGSRAG